MTSFILPVENKERDFSLPLFLSVSFSVLFRCSQIFIMAKRPLSGLTAQALGASWRCECHGRQRPISQFPGQGERLTSVAPCSDLQNYLLP